MVLAAAIVGAAILVGLVIGVLFGEGSVESRLYSALDWAALIAGVFVAPAMALWAWDQSGRFERQMHASIKNVGDDLLNSAHTTIGTITEDLKLRTGETLSGMVELTTGTLKAVNDQRKRFDHEIEEVERVLKTLEGEVKALRDFLGGQGVGEHKRLHQPAERNVVVEGHASPPPVPPPDETCIERAILCALRDGSAGEGDAPPVVPAARLREALPSGYDETAVTRVLRRLREANIVMWTGRDQHSPSPSAQYQLTETGWRPGDEEETDVDSS